MKELNLLMPQHSVYKICKKAMQELEISIEAESPAENYIKGFVKTSFFSYGNNIEVSLISWGNSTSIHIKSESAATLQIVDWGTNAELEDNIAKKILQLSSV